MNFPPPVAVVAIQVVRAVLVRFRVQEMLALLDPITASATHNTQPFTLHPSLPASGLCPVQPVSAASARIEASGRRLVMVTVPSSGGPGWAL